MDLREYFRQNPKAALGFSGGVDSAYLLYAAKSCRADIAAYYVKTAFQPEFEYRDAQSLCRELSVPLKVIEVDVLSDRLIASNPADRCYYCKRRLFSRIRQEAEKDGYDLVIDGTNASDDLSDRPGARALEELAVRSPLRECGLTKERIRELSREAGLFTWNKPAYACLATRVPVGNEITAELLAKVEKSEQALADMGYSDFRVRVFHGAARIQLKAEQFLRAAGEREAIAERIRPFFENIFLDTEVR